MVVDSEHVLRELYRPEHVGDDDVLKERVIPVKCLIETGFSVRRLRHLTIERLRALIDERVSRPRPGGRTWTSDGVSKMDVAAVRALRRNEEPDEQVFVVTDTATTDAPEHASIFAAERGTTKSRARLLRELLLPLLAVGRMTVAEAYSGAPEKGNAEQEADGS